ncbi:hypothetical protein FAM09_23650 [Niastella caeni]|uniref:DUF928 domain-containing protein n=1 Tax=Niastella caeni TaxID=2569763 RepID=A0A4S8HMF9_9BACT|nr:hypothetical protein [Niastella caeni]THU34984.1 hypothetical protein FAM09_23650 [Niastella caeni]
MHKKWLLFGLLLPAMFQVTHAQVSMTLQVPSTGVLLKNQLWNMVLVNAENRNILVKLNLVLLDVQTNQPVITASSAPFSLSKGARQLQARDVSPVQYAYSIPASRVDMDPNGMLPAGRYQACYTVVGVDKGNITLVENCIPVNVDPLSPPLLNTPADAERLLTPYPQFTWLPPTPLGLFNELSYAMVVVEVLPGQGKADAIQQNIPLNASVYTKDLFWNYPASSRSLDTGRLYAWRVVAMNSGKPVALSDIWTFKVSAVKPGYVAEKGVPYVAVKRTQDAVIAAAGNVLRITYDNAAADTTIKYTITSIEEAGNPVVQEGELAVKYGQNQLQVPLRKNNRIRSNKVYLFRFASSRNENWSVKFTVNRQ